jgi:hypothetical protein
VASNASPAASAALKRLTLAAPAGSSTGLSSLRPLPSWRCTCATRLSRRCMVARLRA